MRRSSGRGLAVLLALCGLGPVRPCPAATALQIRPLNQSLELEAGAAFRFRLELTNRSSREATTVALQAADVVQEAGQPERFAAPGSTPYSCASWLTLPAAPLVLAAGKSQEVLVTGRAPRAAHGTHHGAILVRAVPSKAADAATTRITMGVAYAFPVDFAIAGASRRALTITELNCERAPGEAEPTPLQVRAGLANTGDSRLSVRGDIYLRDARHGGLLRRVPLAEGDDLRLLPGARSTLTVALTPAPPPGAYLLELRATCGPPQRETSASRSLELGPDGRPTTAAGPLRTRAQQYELQLQPARLDVALCPGAVTSRQVTVRNATSQPLSCSLSAAPFTVDGAGATVEEPDDPAARLELVPARVRLPAHGAAVVQLRVATGASVEGWREHYWQLRAVGEPGNAPPGPQPVALGQAMVVGVEPQAVEPARPELRRVEARQGLTTTTLRFLLGNGGGRAYAVRGTLILRVGTAQEPTMTLALGPLDAPAVLAGTERLWSIVVAGPVPAEGWRGELRLELAPGRVVSLPFTVAPPPPNAGGPPG